MGKTTTFVKMFLHQWVKQFNKIYIFCPTYKTDDVWASCDEFTRSKKLKVYTYYNEKVVKKLWMYHAKRKEKGHKEHVLFYFDDCGGEKGFKNVSEDGLMNSMSSKCNHANISLIICVQKLKQLPPTTRLNSEAFLTFNVTSELEKKAIYEDFGLPTSFAEFKRKLNDFTKTPYHFYFVNRQGPGQPDFYHNQEKVKITEPIKKTIRKKSQK